MWKIYLFSNRFFLFEFALRKGFNSKGFFFKYQIADSRSKVKKVSTRVGIEGIMLKNVIL